MLVITAVVADWVQNLCPESCNACLTPTTTPPSCVDKFNDCQRYCGYENYYCKDLTNPEQPWVIENCAKFCGLCSTHAFPGHPDEVMCPNP
uniref:ShKT domain-containing protein n=1 Tax=Panagrolaimus sp. ES5 TaxID=591445 RepID=A0AC34FDF7_9BILA